MTLLGVVFWGRGFVSEWARDRGGLGGENANQVSHRQRTPPLPSLTHTYTYMYAYTLRHTKHDAVGGVSAERNALQDAQGAGDEGEIAVKKGYVIKFKRGLCMYIVERKLCACDCDCLFKRDVNIYV